MKENHILTEEQKAKRLANQQAWRRKNLDRVRAYERSRNKIRVEGSRKYHKEHNIKNREKIRDKALQRNYGIDSETYTRMVKDQENLCLICHKEPKAGQKLVVDHNHEYGRIRGLLCVSCNLGLGSFKDNPSFITEAAKYLNRTLPLNGNVLITGVTGQIGSYLAEYCLDKGHKVFGLVRRTSSESLGYCPKEVIVLHGDITDQSSIERAIKEAKPLYFFNLAAQSHVGRSFEEPLLTNNITGMGVINCLEAIRQSGLHIRFLQASTSELFGGISDRPADEQTKFHPRSPYGCAKLMGHWATINYRESFNFFACCAIMFNNESPRRGPEFVTRKITKGIALIKAGKEKYIELGNLDSRRDWSFTGDFVRGLYLQLVESSTPKEFVFASGQAHSIREFCEAAFSYAGLGDYREYIRINPKFYRPAEVDILIGDSSKARKELGWQPKHSFTELVKLMVDADLNSTGLG